MCIFSTGEKKWEKMVRISGRASKSSWYNGRIMFFLAWSLCNSSGRTHQRTLNLFYFTKILRQTTYTLFVLWFYDIKHIPLYVAIYYTTLEAPQRWPSSFLSSSQSLVIFCLSRENSHIKSNLFQIKCQYERARTWKYGWVSMLYYRRPCSLPRYGGRLVGLGSQTVRSSTVGRTSTSLALQQLRWM